MYDERSIPQYQGSLADFLGELRLRSFRAQARAAKYFHLDRSTISRYENGGVEPPIGYIAHLALKLYERYEPVQEIQEVLLNQVNQAIRGKEVYEFVPPFRTWTSLILCAQEYRSVQLSPNHYPINAPLEIVMQGNEATRIYTQSLESHETVWLNEVKVLLVGEGMAGKTSLLKRLQGLSFNRDESQTHGVNVVKLRAKLQGVDGLTDCQLHCWDFGGQEIMHASHQFFLSERALYILLLDSRTDAKKYHWFKHIEEFGGDSPLIVVMNKIDSNPNYNIQQRYINERFPTIQNRFHRISCHTEDGLPELFHAIGQAIPETSLFGTKISVTWMKIKDQLVARTQDERYLSRIAFVDICQQHGVDDANSQQTLLQFLHDLGIVLYFRQLEFANIYVLDPHWVTIGVYKIINSQTITDGKFHVEDLEYILNQEESKRQEYDPAQEKEIAYSLEGQRYILKIMEQFELLYRLDRDEFTYIVPDLLPKELIEEPELISDTPLHFVMRYDYLPKSILPRLMIRLKNDIVEGQQWRYGMILKYCDSGCQAKVELDEEYRTIAIAIHGEPRRKREYFSIIHHALQNINREFKNLVVDEFIPLPGYPDHMVEYEELLGYEQEGIDEYFVGKLRERFSVSELLDSVIDKTERMVIEGGIHSHNHVGNITDSKGIAIGDRTQATATIN